MILSFVIVVYLWDEFLKVMIIFVFVCLEFWVVCFCLIFFRVLFMRYWNFVLIFVIFLFVIVRVYLIIRLVYNYCEILNLKWGDEGE